MSRRADESLFLAEGDIAQRLGLSALEWQAVSAVAEKSGLPRKDTLFGGRRYWPAVRAWLDRRAGIAEDAAPVRDGEEKFHERRKLRARS
jgi:hypothetical protein